MIQDVRKLSNDRVEQVKEWVVTTHRKRKEDYDNRSKVKLVSIKSRDKVLMSQKKSLVDMPLDPAPYDIT